MNKQPVDSTKAIPAKEDAAFLVDAASAAMMEVELGKMAQEKSANVQVKALGTQLVNDHKTGDEKLKALALSKEIILPDSIATSQKKDEEKLAKKTGSSFDNAYINMMVDAHEKDIRQFQKAAKNATDEDIKSFAAGSLPSLYKHLDAARQLQKKMGTKEVPIPVGDPPYQ